MYHLTQTKQGISSLELGRRLGTTQTTAWKIKHKLAQVMMERDAQSRSKAGSKWTMHFSAGSDRAANAGAEVPENSRLLRQWKPRRTAGPCV